VKLKNVIAKINFDERCSNCAAVKITSKAVPKFRLWTKRFVFVIIGVSLMNRDEIVRVETCPRCAPAGT